MYTCAIITTEANEAITPIHDRMPVIVSKEKEDFWLNPEVQDSGALLQVLRPYPEAELEVCEVSLINSPSYDRPDVKNRRSQ